MRKSARRFLSYPGFRNVFSCIACEMFRGDKEDSDGLQCVECAAYACVHLFNPEENDPICFCCSGYPDGEWPDWCFTMIPVNEGRHE